MSFRINGSAEQSGDGEEQPLRRLLGARAALVVQFLGETPFLDQELKLLDDLGDDGRHAIRIMLLRRRKLEGLLSGNGFYDAAPGDLAERVAGKVVGLWLGAAQQLHVLAMLPAAKGPGQAWCIARLG